VNSGQHVISAGACIGDIAKEFDREPGSPAGEREVEIDSRVWDPEIEMQRISQVNGQAIRSF
jgi:hypothetical protein